MVERISVTLQADGAWAVKHRESFLGTVRTRDEAVLIGRHLVDWLSAQGRPADLHVERSFAPTRGRDRPGRC